MKIKSIFTLILSLLSTKQNKNSDIHSADDCEAIADRIEFELVNLANGYLEILALDSKSIKDNSWIVYHRFYNNLTADQQRDFIGVMQHIMIDTASSTLSAITTYGHPYQGIKIINHKGEEIQYLCDDFVAKYCETWRLPLTNNSTI